jgi:hypothetical protein
MFKLSAFRTVMSIFGLWAFIYIMGPYIHVWTDQMFAQMGSTIGITP